ncbi:YeaC family protein [Pseudoalteromonas sp. SSDWG2]|uniref:YeaC family protein n=1 Tax=Pseudoalteromonas sp. SSDWG2 TaxID=3139391 RepID=UPI003BAB79CA
MNVDQLIQSITPDVYERLQYGASTGKWPDGTPLSEEQKAQTMQLVMLYQSKVLKSDEQFTIGADGELVQKSKKELKEQFKPENEIARFSENDL